MDDSGDKTSKLLAQFNQYNTAAARRDKWFRLIQYSCKFLTLGATDRGFGGLEIVKKLKGAETASGDARKLFRLVGSADFLQKAIESFHKADLDIVERVFQTLGYAGRVLWLLHDHCIWLTKAGIMKGDLAKLSYRSAVAWLIALTFLLIRDLRRLTLLDEKFRSLKHRQDATGADLARLKSQLKSGRVEFWKNFLDIFVPLSTLGRVNPKIGALCGVLSTVVSIWQEWKKVGQSMVH